jgi:hypothetical protein
MTELHEMMSALMLCFCMVSKSLKDISHCSPLSHAAMALLKVTTFVTLADNACSKAARALIQSLPFSNAVISAQNDTVVGTSSCKRICSNKASALCHFSAFEHALIHVLKVMASGGSFRNFMSRSKCKAQVHFELFSQALMVALCRMDRVELPFRGAQPLFADMTLSCKSECKCCNAAAHWPPWHRGRLTMFH